MRVFACVILLALASCSALGCTCDDYQYPVCEQLRSYKGSALFVGVVQKIDIKSVMFGKDKVRVQFVTFSVEESFSGVEGKTINVMSFADAAMCGVQFQKSMRYLVDASEIADSTYLASRGKSGFRSHLNVDSCGMTARADYASDSIRFLRAVQRNPSGAIVFGTVKQYVKGSTFVSLENKAVTGASVLLQTPADEGERRETPVDSSGYYEFVGLPAGVYTHTVKVPDGFTGVLQHTVEVKEQSCAQVDVRVHGNTE